MGRWHKELCREKKVEGTAEIAEKRLCAGN